MSKNPQEIVPIHLARYQVQATLEAIGVAIKSPAVPVDSTIHLSNLYQIIRVQEENYIPPIPPKPDQVAPPANANPADSNPPGPG